MVVLKKLKASTLMETMVATGLIVVIFMMASMLLNSIFSSSLHTRENGIEARLQQLEYEVKNGTIALPYFEESGEWDIELLTENRGLSTYLLLEATHKKTKKQIKNYSPLAK